MVEKKIKEMGRNVQRMYVKYMVVTIGKTATKTLQTPRIEETKTRNADALPEGTSITTLASRDATVTQDLPLHVRVRHQNDASTAEV